MRTCFRIYRLRYTAGWWLASSTFFNWAYATHPARSILNLVDISWNISSLDSRFHNCYLHLPKTTVYCIITRWQWGWWLFLLMAMSGLATNFTIWLDGWMGIYTPCFQVARCRWWTWNHGTDPKLQGNYFQYDESFHTYGAVSQIKCFISDGFLFFEWNWQSFTGKKHMTNQLQYSYKSPLTFPLRGSPAMKFKTCLTFAPSWNVHAAMP